MVGAVGLAGLAVAAADVEHGEMSARDGEHRLRPDAIDDHRARLYRPRPRRSAPRLLERQRRVRRALAPEPAIEPQAIGSAFLARVAFAGVAGALRLAFALANLPGGGSLTTEAAELAAAPDTAPAPKPTGSTLAPSVDGV